LCIPTTLFTLVRAFNTKMARETWEKFLMTAYLYQKVSKSWCILQYFFLHHTEAGLFLS